MRIGIDARFYGSIGKGLGRYTQKLIEKLEKVDGENRYFVFLRKENFDEYRPKNKNFQKVLADYRWYTFAEQIMMPRLLGKYELDLVHFPHFNVPIFYRKKFVITIHDLILIHFPTLRGTTLNPLFYFFKFLAYKMTIKSAISRARRIIAVSEFTKKDIVDNYKVQGNKIKITYEACEDFCFFSEDSAKTILKKYGIINPYIMYVGNAYPHKNLSRLVLAFNKIRESEEDLRLVLVGKEDYFYRQLKETVRRKKIENVIFAGFVPDCDLDELYKNSRAYVFPSLYEGFGLPPLEAMAKGVPVASSSHSCMKEILGNSAWYFDGRRIEDMADKIIEILKNEPLRKELIGKGYDRAKKYSWHVMARKTLEIYNESGSK